ncbi:hypothetical protein WA538_002370 [Blastocystis sp. DL]
MSEEKITGFAALMRARRRKQQKQEEEESVEVKPVIRETTLTSIDERIKQLEQQLNDPEDDGFVDVDSSSDSSDSGETNESMDTTAKEKEVLEKLRQTTDEDIDAIQLGPNEGYCEICNCKLSGDLEISTHIESTGHLMRLKVVFKNDLAISSHRPNTCTTCGVFFDSTKTLLKHRDYRGHVNNGRLKKRVCYCSLCSKQFTSGQQLAEHVGSSPSSEVVVEGQGAQGTTAVRVG